LTFGAITGGWIAAAVFTVLISLLTDKSGYSMSWYGNPWLILGLYVAPTIAFSSAFLPFIRHEVMRFLSATTDYKTTKLTNLLCKKSLQLSDLIFNTLKIYNKSKLQFFFFAREKIITMLVLEVNP
jgi:hypothetical protein